MPAAQVERVVRAAAIRLDPLVNALLRVGVIRRRLHRRAIKARANAPLVLCYGNINRSPFAAALIGAPSSGFYPEAQRPSPDRAIAAALAHGVDLAPHRSSRVSREELLAAPALLVFDTENLAQVALNAPRALARTHLVGALAKSGDVCIVDPHGRPDEALAQVYARIAEAVRTTS